MNTEPYQSSPVQLPDKAEGWQRRRHSFPTFVVLLVAVGLGFAAALVPVPYVIHGPGPTFDVLGSQGETPILEVEGVTAPADQSGQLRMVTVSELGGPGTTVTAMNVIQAWMTAGNSVLPYSEVYPEGVTVEQVQQAGAAQMESSHSTASVAALEYLGYELPTVITIVDAVTDSGADRILEANDILVSVRTPDGIDHPMNASSAPFMLMKTVPAGTDLEVTVERYGTEITLTVPSTADPDNPDAAGSKLGVLLSFDIDMPLQITFHLEKVGGPSAGTVFALGIIDEITGKDMTGGEIIAGTGALGYDGTVEPIGGIVQKMYGSVRDGAKWFLAPADNCDSVVGQVPEGITVFAVATLKEAVTATTAIGQGDTSDLTTCEAVVAGN